MRTLLAVDVDERKRNESLEGARGSYPPFSQYQGLAIEGGS